ncbi:unnamed protein product, partial [Urochloa humidicola]
WISLIRRSGNPNPIDLPANQPPLFPAVLQTPMLLPWVVLHEVPVLQRLVVLLELVVFQPLVLHLLVVFQLLVDRLPVSGGHRRPLAHPSQFNHLLAALNGMF